MAAALQHPPCFAAPPSQSREHSFFLSFPAFTSSTSPLNKEGKKKKTVNEES